MVVRCLAYLIVAALAELAGDQKMRCNFDGNWSSLSMCGGMMVSDNGDGRCCLRDVGDSWQRKLDDDGGARTRVRENEGLR